MKSKSLKEDWGNFYNREAIRRGALPLTNSCCLIAPHRLRDIKAPMSGCLMIEREEKEQSTIGGN